MSQYLIDRIRAHQPNIEVHTDTELSRLIGEPNRGCRRSDWRNRRTGVEQELPIQHVFLFIGADPNAEWLKDCAVAVDAKGFVQTGSDICTPLRLHTDVSTATIDCRLALEDQSAGSIRDRRCARGLGEASGIGGRRGGRRSWLNCTATSRPAAVGHRRATWSWNARKHADRVAASATALAAGGRGCAGRAPCTTGSGTLCACAGSQESSARRRVSTLRSQCQRDCGIGDRTGTASGSRTARRLRIGAWAIIDLSAAGAQPMCLGPHVLTYNGELYNYRSPARQPARSVPLPQRHRSLVAAIGARRQGLPPAPCGHVRLRGLG